MIDLLIDLNDIRAAQARIAGYVRRTPLVEARPLKRPLTNGSPLYLKLENTQITGSFKARGAVNKLFSLAPEQVKRGIITASGGNHGLGVAYAGWLAKSPATIFLSHNSPPIKARKLESWGAKVIYEGEVWDDANREAVAMAERDGLAYIHPFADPVVIAGQGTLGIEILAEQPDIDVILVAIGGGGLISGVSLAVKALKPSVRVIGIEPTGAPTLYESVRQNQLVQLAEIRTAANTLAPRQSAAINLEIIRQHVDEIVLVSDDDMREAARWLWQEMGVAAELSGAAALAALLCQKVRLSPSERVCVLVCGAGSDGID